MRGFTLVEALVSMAIVGITIFAAVSFVSFNNKSLAFVRRQTTAIQLANNQMEDLTGRSPSDSELQPGEYHSYFDRNGKQIPGASEGVFDVQWVVSVNASVSTIIDITVRVSWRDMDGSPRGVNLQSSRSGI